MRRGPPNRRRRSHAVSLREVARLTVAQCSRRTDHLIGLSHARRQLEPAIRFAARQHFTVAESLAALGDPLQEPTYLQNTSERPWSTRRVRVAELLLNKGVEVIGELLPIPLPSKSKR